MKKETAKTNKKPPTKKLPGMPAIGDCVFIRSVTNYYTGRLVNVTDGFLVLEEAAWVADTGRFHNYLMTGQPNEVEPYPDGVFVRVNIGSVSDICDWKHPLLRVQK